MNDLIKEAHKMADKALFKAKLDSAKQDAVKWLQGEAEGFKRWHNLCGWFVKGTGGFLVA